jgi:hypothetical protein
MCENIQLSSFFSETISRAALYAPAAAKRRVMVM